MMKEEIILRRLDGSETRDTLEFESHYPPQVIQNIDGIEVCFLMHSEEIDGVAVYRELREHDETRIWSAP